MIESKINNIADEQVDMSTDNGQTKEVAESPQCDIVADKNVPALKPNPLAGAKTCDRTQEQRTAIRQTRRAFWIDRDGLVSFDPKERAELADSLRHNR